jgi:hypothetical protein
MATTIIWPDRPLFVTLRRFAFGTATEATISEDVIDADISEERIEASVADEVVTATISEDQITAVVWDEEVEGDLCEC